MSELVYLYGFVPPGSPAPGDLAGIAEAPVAVVDSGVPAFRAVVSSLPATDWSADVLDGRLKDLRWVAARGLEHERVVAWFVDHAEILPASLFTLYTGEPALHAAVAGRGELIAQQLDHFRGLREWDLKVGYDADTLTVHAGALSDEIRAFDAELETAPPGRRYLLEKKRAVLVAAQLTDVARREAIALLDRLEPVAREVRTLPLPRTDRDLPVVLHAALLLDRQAAPAVSDRVTGRGEELRRVGISVDWSGPWAPYRFLRHADD